MSKWHESTKAWKLRKRLADARAKRRSWRPSEALRAAGRLMSELAQQAPSEREISLSSELFTELFGPPTRRDRKSPMPRLGIYGMRDGTAIGVREDVTLARDEFRSEPAFSAARGMPMGALGMLALLRRMG